MQWRIRADPGRHARCNCPVALPLEGCPATAPVVVAVDCPHVLDGTCQVDSLDGEPMLRFVLTDMPAGNVAEFVVDDRSSAASWDGGVSVTENGEDRLRVAVRESLFTELNFGDQWVRPFFYPVIGPTGCGVTRNFPMQDALPTEREDHVHHKSLYVAHGDVNGADVWSETKGHGSQVQDALIAAASGPLMGLLQTRNRWRGNDGEDLVADVRDVRFYCTAADVRILDFSLELTAEFGEVTFGDTKEGGLVSVRVAGSMKGSSGGLISNAYGGLTEKECWGKAAPWVDYSGEVDGERVGIAVFDHPLNPLYPTRWHVRDYGLFTANPFGLSHYKSGFQTNGDFLLTDGASVTFRYRLLIHKGGVCEAGVSERFLDYVCPPDVSAEPVA